MIENQKHINNIPFINEEVTLGSKNDLKKLNTKLNTALELSLNELPLKRLILNTYQKI